MFRTTCLAAALIVIGTSGVSAAPTLLDENDLPINSVTGQPLTAPSNHHRLGPHRRSATPPVASPTVSGRGRCFNPVTKAPMKCAPAMLTPTRVHD